MKDHSAKFIYSALAILLCLGVFADSAFYEVSGVISDRKTGKNIYEVKVQLERNGEIIIETKTKEDGTFVIRAPESDMAHGKIEVRVLKRGYKPQILSAIPGTKNNLNVQLEKLKAVPIMVPKKSPTGQYIIVQNIQQQSLSNYKTARSID
jgi:hypothetical protein